MFLFLLLLTTCWSTFRLFCATCKLGRCGSIVRGIKVPLVGYFWTVLESCSNLDHHDYWKRVVFDLVVCGFTTSTQEIALISLPAIEPRSLDDHLYLNAHAVFYQFCNFQQSVIPSISFISWRWSHLGFHYYRFLLFHIVIICLHKLRRLYHAITSN